ncbi:hypothetical protein CEQ90_08605 [Lewinellaceae bacterium SD302]|nr:hypothetical protein CEQ90_08605 [Lewinellaceae bacterium SD302]
MKLLIQNLILQLMIATAISQIGLNLLTISQASWTSEQYRRMYEAGVLSDDDRVELLMGKITEMSPIGRFHAACVMRLQKIFIPKLISNYSWRTENPIVLPDNSEPEPDFALLKHRDDDYVSGHPAVDDVLLVIEVADKTLLKDREVKASIYASAGIAEYWIVNLIDRQLERYEQPISEVGSYELSQVSGEKDSFDHPILGEVIVANILP